MKRKTEHEITVANRPEEIFTLDPAIIEQEKDEYLRRFKPAEHRAIQNFVVTRKIMLLYDEAIAMIDNGFKPHDITITSANGENYNIHYISESSFKLGHMYITRNHVIYVVESKYKKYYDNYVRKTKRYSKPDMEIWKSVQYMVPDVENHFEITDGNFCIMVRKPCTMYSMREILEYFDGYLKPEYVASILTRLYYFACYMEMVETTHNGITLDNLFFAPGRRTEEGEEYTVHDMRIVGIYGGWFFTTYFSEKLQGVPREVYDILPEDSKKRGYSSFEVDALSIKQVAKELLGNQKDIPLALEEWLNTTHTESNAYMEYRKWEEVRRAAFGKRRFVDMDVSI